jgi:hypothetical protein
MLTSDDPTLASWLSTVIKIETDQAHLRGKLCLASEAILLALPSMPMKDNCIYMTP